MTQKQCTNYLIRVPLTKLKLPQKKTCLKNSLKFLMFGPPGKKGHLLFEWSKDGSECGIILPNDTKRESKTVLHFHIILNIKLFSIYYTPFYRLKGIIFINIVPFL